MWAYQKKKFPFVNAEFERLRTSERSWMAILCSGMTWLFILFVEEDGIHSFDYVVKGEVRRRK